MTFWIEMAVCGSATFLNLGILAMNLKLYTEIFKQFAQRAREDTRP